MKSASGHSDGWVQRGKVYLWRYRTGSGNFPGWHLTAEDAACDSLGEQLRHLRASPRRRPVTVSTTKPTPAVLALPNNGSNIRGGATLMLDFDPARAPGNWRLTTADATVTVEFGLGNLDNLAKGLADIKAGRGDYGIGPRGEGLWFWWQPRAV